MSETAARLGITAETLLQPGAVIWMKENGENGFPAGWHLAITEVDGQAFRGLLRPLSARTDLAGLPRRLSDRVEGELDGEELRLSASSYDIEGDAFEPRVHYVGSIAGLSPYGAEVRPEGESAMSRFLGSSSYRLSHLGIDEAGVREEAARQDAALTRARARWAEIRPEVERLRQRGHALSVLGALENGEVDLSWSDYRHSGERNTPGRTIDDYRVLAELKDLPYIHYLSAGQLRDPDDVKHLRGLKHIGQLYFSDYSGEGIEVLDGGPQVDHLQLVSTTNEGLASIARFSSLRAAVLNFQDVPIESITPEAVRALGRHPNLRYLDLVRIPRGDPATFGHLAGLKQLTTLCYNGRMTLKALDELPRLEALENLYVHNVDPELVPRLQHPGLRQIAIGFSWELDEKHLSAWELPATVEHLSLPIWTPGEAAEHVRRLKTMTAEEMGCYLAVRALTPMLDDFRKAPALMDRMQIVGGGLLTDTRPEERGAVMADIQQTLNDLRQGQVEARVLIPRIAQQVQDRVQTLLDHEAMPLANAVAIQGMTYPYSGQWIPGVEDLISPGSRAGLEQTRAQVVRILSGRGSY